MKSTIIANAAVELFDRGFTVGVIDADYPQYTMVNDVTFDEPRISARQIGSGKSAKKEITAAVDSLKKTCDVILIDTPGKSEDLAMAVAQVADFLLIPLQPSHRDVRAADMTLGYVKAEQARRGKPQATFVIGLTRKNSQPGRELREALLATTNIPVAETVIRRLDGFAVGTAVVRSGDPACKEAAKDIRALIDEVIIPLLSDMKQVAANG